MTLKIGVVAAALALNLSAAGAWAADDVFLAQGNKQWEAGKLADARKSFELAVAADPRSADAHMKLGGLLLASSDHAAAIRTYQRTISLDANNAKAWMGLGLAYLHTGQRELSQAAFDEAIRIEPSRKAQLARLAEKPAQEAASREPSPVKQTLSN
ncbi:MAG: tetratricopeptide repeat protein [Rhodocyclales bacterium]|nr:tetratricopeptide repeat protein [Rhodocyclales bacterium]